MRLLSKPGCPYLVAEDLIPLIQDVVDTHPGLTFLQDAPEFHSRYVHTVSTVCLSVCHPARGGYASWTHIPIGCSGYVHTVSCPVSESFQLSLSLSFSLSPSGGIHVTTTWTCSNLFTWDPPILTQLFNMI